MSEASKEASPSSGIVRDLFDPSPSLRFELERKKEDGSVEVYPFRCRLLRADQVTEAIEAAQKFANGRDLPGYGDIYREAQTYEILQRAIVQEEMGERMEGARKRRWYRPVFVDTAQLRASLDESECARMMDCYELTKAHYKVTEVYSEEEAERLIDGLADEMMGPYFLGRLDSADWPQLIFGLARLALSWRPPSPPTPSSSPNSSESSPSNSESGTTTFSELPSVRSADIPSVADLPNDRMLTREEARQVVKRQQEGHEE